MRRSGKVAIALAGLILVTIALAVSPLHLGPIEAVMVVTSFLIWALILVALGFAVARVIDLITALIRRRRSKA